LAQSLTLSLVTMVLTEIYGFKLVADWFSACWPG